jgi:hypothetical protein
MCSSLSMGGGEAWGLALLRGSGSLEEGEAGKDGGEERRRVARPEVEVGMDDVGRRRG